MDIYVVDNTGCIRDRVHNTSDMSSTASQTLPNPEHLVWTVQASTP